MRRSTGLTVITTFVFHAVLAWSAPSELLNGGIAAQLSFAPTESAGISNEATDYKGQQVWRLNTGEMTKTERDVLRDVIEVSTPYTPSKIFGRYAEYDLDDGFGYMAIR